jgi:phospholipid:diacylglycerol acyltransferase
MPSSLRKRILGGPSREGTPPEKAEEVRLAPVSKILKEHKRHKGIKRRNGFIFFLGGLFGLVAAGFFAGRSDLIDFPDVGDLSMDSLMDVLPAGFVTDARDLAVRMMSIRCVLFDWR